MPKLNVSVIIPHYNSSQYLEQCLKSVRLQNYSIEEIIIVDDGSSKEHVNVVKELCFRYQTKLICLKKNKGPSYARNEGVIASKGNWVQFLDADDMLAPGSIKYRLTKAANKSPIIGGIIMCIPHYAILEKKRFQFLGWALSSRDIIKSNIKSALLFLNDKFVLRRKILQYNGSRYLFSRELFDKYGLFDEELRRGEDVEFIMRLTGIAKIFPVQCMTISYLYRIHPLQVTRSPKASIENLIRETNLKKRHTFGINRSNTRFP